MAMEEALGIIREQVAPEILASMPEGGSIKYRGTAEALDEALTSMTGSFLLAVVILYLLISALFRSFRDSLLVIMTIPMATVGGVVALRLIDLALFASGGQQMDLLTMIGFVILLGLVVNNAILLVYRARDAEREGMSRKDAVESAVRLRLRPILMSTTTSIFGRPFSPEKTEGHICQLPIQEPHIKSHISLYEASIADMCNVKFPLRHLSAHLSLTQE